MTQEQKARAYDEAIKRAKEINNEKKAQPFDVMLKVFPELKESEDEKIRKELIRAFKSLNTIKVWNGIERTDILAWLEKQTSDKFEPKFKNGQWIVWQDKCYKVNYNGCEYELVDQNGLSTSLEYGTIDENAHLWTILDAKPGDVIYLPNGNNEYYFFIFKGIENAAVMSFAHFYQYDDGRFEVEGTIDNISSVNDVFRPATKEQRDLLFQKIQEAGYELDAEKKELKLLITNGGDFESENCEQKHSWSEEDERMYRGLYNLIYSTQYCNSRKKLSDWLKSLKERIGE